MGCDDCLLLSVNIIGIVFIIGTVIYCCFFCTNSLTGQPNNQRRQAGRNDIESNQVQPQRQPNNPPHQKIQVLMDSVFDKNKTNKTDDDKECSICLEEFKNGDKCGVLSSCKHVHHKVCIQLWLNGGDERSCPKCRAPAH
ncbi:RING/U-box superfamily protein [Euphorbia peplus]|nr:RING/U-box superfamily protein [Euphorbia peplus]